MARELTRDERRAAIAAKLNAGALPMEAPARTRVGTGTDRPCAACDRAIPAAEPEFGADFTDWQTLHLHTECFAEWRRLAILRLITHGP